MAMMNVGKALDFILEVQQSQAHSFAQIAQSSESQEIKEAAHCLANHYKHFAKSLEMLPADQYKDIRKVTLPFGPQLSDFQNIFHKYSPDVSSVHNMVSRALELNKQIAEVCKNISQQDLLPDICELFENLAKFEEIDEYEIAKIGSCEVKGSPESYIRTFSTDDEKN